MSDFASYYLSDTLPAFFAFFELSALGKVENHKLGDVIEKVGEGIVALHVTCNQHADEESIYLEVRMHVRSTSIHEELPIDCMC